VCFESLVRALNMLARAVNSKLEISSQIAEEERTSEQL
jgi:hypothetical protein